MSGLIFGTLIGNLLQYSNTGYYLSTCVFLRFSAFFVFPFGVAFSGRLPGVTFAEVTQHQYFLQRIQHQSTTGRQGFPVVDLF